MQRNTPFRDRFNVGFQRHGPAVSHLQRMTASLIGCLGQARFPSFFWIIVAHPGHASLRSLFDAPMAPLHAYVGSAVESPAFRRASSCAADIFGFTHEPRPVRDDPVRIGGRALVHAVPPTWS